MRYLWRITVVNKKSEQVAGVYQVVAEDNGQALIKTNLPEDVRSDLAKFAIISEKVGEVGIKKDVQRVEIAKEEA